MHDEQAERFETIRQLVDNAQDTLESIRHLTKEHLGEVHNDSSKQAACLQQVQQRAGEVVQALTDAANVARHARSFQAQDHTRKDR